MTWLKYLMLSAVFIAVAAAPWFGLYRDHDDQSCRLFIKHRPSLHWYFQTDVRLSRSLHDCPPEVAAQARQYTEFIVRHAGYDRSIRLPGL